MPEASDYDPERRRAIEEIFHEGLTLPVDEREAFLESSSSDPEIRAEIGALLELHERKARLPVDSPERFNAFLREGGTGGAERETLDGSGTLTDPERRLVWHRLWWFLEQIKANVLDPG